MRDLQYEVLSRNGKKLFAIIPYEQFMEFQEKLEDAEDLRLLDEAIEEGKSQRTYSIDEVRHLLNCPRKKPALKRSKSK